MRRIPEVITTLGLVRVFMAVANHVVIDRGDNSYGKGEIGSTIGVRITRYG